MWSILVFFLPEAFTIFSEAESSSLQADSTFAQRLYNLLDLTTACAHAYTLGQGRVGGSGWDG